MKQLKIHISSGTAWHGEEFCTFEDLAGCADIALYEAKETRKGQTVEYKDEAAAAFCILSGLFSLTGWPFLTFQSVFLYFPP